MRQYLPVLLVLAVLITAGCVEETPATTIVTTAPPATTAPDLTPVPAQTPPPAEMAYLSGILCVVGDRSEAAYHCNGNVRVRSGPSHQVQVIARYPDNNTFESGTVELGGSNPVLAPFFLFPDLKYKGQDPKYFVKLDNTPYPVTWSGETGTAWSNMPA
jgi:hypothetical protein